MTVSHRKPGAARIRRGWRICFCVGHRAVSLTAEIRGSGIDGGSAKNIAAGQNHLSHRLQPAEKRMDATAMGGAAPDGGRRRSGIGFQYRHWSAGRISSERFQTTRSRSASVGAGSRSSCISPCSGRPGLCFRRYRPAAFCRWPGCSDAGVVRSQLACEMGTDRCAASLLPPQPLHLRQCRRL